jgi:hypothetical protein
MGKEQPLLPLLPLVTAKNCGQLKVPLFKHGLFFCHEQVEW